MLLNKALTQSRNGTADIRGLAVKNKSGLETSLAWIPIKQISQF